MVVPVYRELDSENLHQLIRSIERLDRSATDVKIKVLFIVNNAAEEAHSNYPHPEAYNENQRTLDDLRNIAESMAQKNIEIHVLDCSTVGNQVDNTLFETKVNRNIGLVRDTGVHYALDHLIPLPEDEESILQMMHAIKQQQPSRYADHRWIIAMMDADSKLDPYWLKGLLDAYKDPSVQVVLTQMNYFLPPGSSLDVIRSSFDTRILLMMKSILRIIGFGPYHPWGGGTPRITARASVYLRHGGFPQFFSKVF